MFDYDAERLRGVIRGIARANISTEAWLWLDEQSQSQESSVLNAAFSSMPRKTGKLVITVASSDLELISKLKPGYLINGFSTDQLCRIYLLMHVDPKNKEVYLGKIENLFLAADMGELTALYSALPVLAYPENWTLRCAEGIRSNMAPVLESLMYWNPYPSSYFDEKAWNQMVLKAFFTDKDINKIYRFDERSNAELASTLSDYAHERWAAGRSVNPLLWRGTSKFMTPTILADLKKVLGEGQEPEKKAAALAIYFSPSGEAKKLIDNHEDLLKQIADGGLSWENVLSQVGNNN